ncbi:hypothetical protein [Kitasatospora sp. NPDC093806]|uniref:hypothetical protein n=1 Tax=Kitasatospora sp. NPDC093806 TaxID=3155075 RepID=UPI0034436642
MTRNLSDPSDRPARTLTLSGLLGDSDRPGHRRLYFNKQLDYYAEFASEDVLSVEDVASDQPPFVGLGATKVTLRRDAPVSFTQVHTAPPLDEFDLDLRLAQPRRTGQDTPVTVLPEGPETWEAECPGPTWGDCPTEFACATDFDCPTGITVCKPRTCQCTENATCETCAGDTCRTCGEGTCATCRDATCFTCQTCGRDTCVTCQTCDRATCHTCGEGTCATCREATCVTCATCGRATCVTCEGETCRTCGEGTCDTCFGRTCRICPATRDTCNPHVFTCGPNPRCRI